MRRFDSKFAVALTEVIELVIGKSLKERTHVEHYGFGRMELFG